MWAFRHIWEIVATGGVGFLIGYIVCLFLHED